MQQRRVRLGDILDDYCPRERRITNHAVVAMIEDDVKQTRCTTCDADHEYKDGKVPVARRRKSEGVLGAVDADSRPELVAADANVQDDDDALEEVLDAASDDAIEPAEPALFAAPETTAADEISAAGDDSEEGQPTSEQDNWPVHRPLIRATLPRPEGHVPERKEPEFTMRQSRFEGNRNGQRHNRGGGGHRRQAQGQPGQFGQFGHRPSGQGQGQGQGQGGERNGNRAPQPGQRSGGRAGGGQGGQRHGGGRGPNRGR
jgi:hypothetical protein